MPPIKTTFFTRSTATERQWSLSRLGSRRITPAIDATKADLVRQISTAQQPLSGVSAFTLSATPEQFTSNHEILAPTRAPVKIAMVAATKARADVSSVKSALQ